ncbi:bacillithiol biosynthesis cysteine-adding enzyme BshC [Saprospiraceae bacterium]|nr:bacillithiol biosynthesis cysteine-adding enzyme BshC [Saprospiraceae bacterium]
MNVDYIDFQDFPQLSSRDKAYQAGNDLLRPFYNYDFEYSAFGQVIEDRKKFPVDRAMLVEELTKTYSKIDHSSEVAKNIASLADEKTFTVITAHQPSLFTGPLYFIIKIASAINLAKKLNEDHPSYKIIPVFILGAEDHDFEEINHTYIYNKKISWEREASGSVGRLDKQELDVAISTLKDILGDSENAKSLKTMIDNAYNKAKNYGEFSFSLTHQLFDRYGLVIANYDNRAFKKAFAPIIKKEITEQYSKVHVLEAQKQIVDAGFSDQAFARDINFFYLQDGKRSRIEKNGDKYKVVDTELEFSLDEILREVDQYPDRFSPNVIMRPLYQETIMPNLAYIGGGGELAYWLERKSQFTASNVFLPMLVRRNSVLWVNERNQKQLEKLSLSIHDLLQDTDQLVKSYALQESDHDVNFDGAFDKINEAYNEISEISVAIDGSLGQKLEAMKASNINGLEKLQARLIKSIKQNQEVKINQVRKVKDSLFPAGSLQERKSNFMEFYLKNGDSMIDTLVAECFPLEKRFLVITEH